MIPLKQSTSFSSTSESSILNPAQSLNANDEMRIAWRYNNLEKIDSEQGGASQKDGNNSYTFDLSQSIENGALNSMDITLYGKNDEMIPSNTSAIFHNPDYVSLIQKLHDKMSESTFDASGQTTTTKKNLLRISIESLGSPLWYNEHFTEDLCLFLTILKAAMRVSLSVCCITAPTHLFKHIVSKYLSYTFSFFMAQSTNLRLKKSVLFLMYG